MFRRLRVSLGLWFSREGDMMPNSLDLLSRLLCPEVLRGPAQRLKQRLRIRLGRLKAMTSLEEFDRELDRIDRHSDPETHVRLLGELWLNHPWTPPADPMSPEYRQAVMQMYFEVSGRSTYEASVNEWVPDLGPIEQVHPYSSGSSLLLGEHLMAVGFLIRAMGLTPGMNVLEFGPGYGNTTIELARFGAHVTAVDLISNYLELVGKRTQGLAGKVELVRSDMLEFRPTKKYDRILFFQCFHHCSDPVRMLEQMKDWLAPGGIILFAGEPITEGFPVPWGLRTDGMSAYYIRRFGWLELGFNSSFFKKLLTTQGWAFQVHQSMDVNRISLYLASRAR